jgi:hypothetical protein
MKPSELDKTTVIPELVFEIMNALITVAWDGFQAVVRQDAFVERISQGLGISRTEVFDRNYLNVEDAYRKVGWNVAYDKPGFNEAGEALFVFKKRQE